MKRLWKQAGQALVILLATAALAAAKSTTMAVPGTLNYVEGQVVLNGQTVPATVTGSELLGANQILATKQGKAELLLTPGVFFRAGDNSDVRMVSPGLANTKVDLMKGSAILEVDELFKENNLAVALDGATTRIDKTGLYAFNADHPAVRVLDGKATVYEGDAQVTLKKGHEVLLANGQPFKSRHFDKQAVETDPLYRWSKLRSQYESEANVETAQMVVAYGGWFGPGWYWDPFWDFYAFLPGEGMLFSPFGWGLYSPGWIGWAPYYGLYHYPVVRGPGFWFPRTALRHFAGARGFAMAPRMGSGGFHGGLARR